MDPVVLPFFLARGYHVLNDVPAAVERHGSGTVTGHLGVEEHLVEAVAQRLHEASAPLGGLAGLDHIVLGAAGSRQGVALEEVEAITRLLEARLGRRVTPAYLSAARPSVRDAVSSARARGARRVGVATYLLAEGRFHRALHSTGADVVAAPIGDHPAVAELVVHRYRGSSPDLEALPPPRRTLSAEGNLFRTSTRNMSLSAEEECQSLPSSRSRSDRR